MTEQKSTQMLLCLYNLNWWICLGVWQGFPCFDSVVWVRLDLLYCKLLCNVSTIAKPPTLQSILNVCLAFELSPQWTMEQPQEEGWIAVWWVWTFEPCLLSDSPNTIGVSVGAVALVPPPMVQHGQRVQVWVGSFWIMMFRQVYSFSCFASLSPLLGTDTSSSF